MHVQVLVPEMEEEALLDFPEIKGHVALVQVEASVVSELVHVLPR